MKDWTSRQLRSYMDAHGIDYQAPYPPQLKEKHYQRYLLKVLSRAGKYNPKDECSMAPRRHMGMIEFKAPIITMICPFCAKQVSITGECECTDAEQHDGGTAL